MIVSLFGCCDFDSNVKYENNKFSDSNCLKFEKEDCIVKVGNKWRIKGNKVKYWNAEFDTKKDAQAALRAYWTNKK